MAYRQPTILALHPSPSLPSVPIQQNSLITQTSAAPLPWTFCHHFIFHLCVLTPSLFTDWYFHVGLKPQSSLTRYPGVGWVDCQQFPKGLNTPGSQEPLRESKVIFQVTTCEILP